MRYTNVLYALNTKNTEPNMARVFMDFDDCVASRDKQLNENSMQDTRGDLGAIKIRKEHR